MKTPIHSSPKVVARRVRGSTLVVVMVLALVLGFFLVSIMGRGQSEQRLTDRNTRFHEALNAAESLGNYGIADVVRRYTTRAFLPPDEFQSNPLSIPETGFFDDTYIDKSYNELIGGSIGAAVRTYIPEDAENANDPLKGSVVDAVDVHLYSRSAANPILEPEHPARAFLRQTLKVRYVNLTDALFYNMDLELHPGPEMTFKGKVHTNRDLYVIAGNDQKLTFYDSVTASGKILHLYKLTMAQSGGHNGDVLFVHTRSPLTFESMRLNTNNLNTSWVYNRPGNPEWLSESRKRWNNNVMDVAHEVPTRNPAGIPEYVPANPATGDELENHAYAVIEPLLQAGHANRKSTAGRHQKFHARACLVFKVQVLPSSDPRYNPAVGGIYVTAYTWERVNSSIPINSQSPFDGNMKLDANGDPIPVDVYLPPGIIGAMTVDARPTPARDVQYYDSATSSVTTMNTMTYIRAGEDSIPERFVMAGDTVTRGMIDDRQDLDLSPITLDVHRLREVVDERAHATRTAEKMADFWIDPADSTRKVTFDPKTQWNGVVYVEFPTVATAPRSGDGIVPAIVKDVGIQHLNLSLQVVHGETVPNAPVRTDASVPATSRYANPNPGFTIATNAPLYLIGNYNSDGKTTGAADQPDTWVDAKGRPYSEPPAGIACDAFTVLSRNWVRGAQDLDENGSRDGGGTWVDNRKNSDDINCTNRNASWTEVSVSVITGLIPTKPADPTKAISGGAHNFPRFLEKWTKNVPLRMRTSLNALFESEAHTKPMPDGPSYYDPPFRDWGQPDILVHPQLSVIPPAWIQVLDFRLGGVKQITEAEYEAVVGPLR